MESFKRRSTSKTSRKWLSFSRELARFILWTSTMAQFYQSPSKLIRKNLSLTYLQSRKQNLAKFKFAKKTFKYPQKSGFWTSCISVRKSTKSFWSLQVMATSEVGNTYKRDSSWPLNPIMKKKSSSIISIQKYTVLLGTM